MVVGHVFQRVSPTFHSVWGRVPVTGVAAAVVVRERSVTEYPVHPKILSFIRRACYDLLRTGCTSLQEYL
jgi:hypothetical protein